MFLLYVGDSPPPRCYQSCKCCSTSTLSAFLKRKNTQICGLNSWIQSFFVNEKLIMWEYLLAGRLISSPPLLQRDHTMFTLDTKPISCMRSTVWKNVTSNLNSGESVLWFICNCSPPAPIFSPNWADLVSVEGNLCLPLVTNSSDSRPNIHIAA